MRRSERDRARDPSARRFGRVLRWVAGALVVLLTAGAVAVYQLDLGARWLGLSPSPTPGPAEVAPPPGLTLPEAAQAPPVAVASPSGVASPARVRRALRGLVSKRALGPHVAVQVAALSDGRPVYRSGGGPMAPASTMKLLTTAAALETLGPDHRFRTSTVASPGTRTIVLVGGGDPFLERLPDREPGGYPNSGADLASLAADTARALRERGRTTIRLGYDTSLFSGPAVSPRWEPSYVPDDVVTPLATLWTNEGRRRSGQVSTTPGADAAEQFARALAQRRIVVRGTPERMRARGGAEELAAVEGAPLEQVVQHILEVSDNEGAEVLFRHVALATGRPGSFSGGATAVRGILDRIGVDVARARIHDGSGLSRGNRLTPGTLISLIELAAGEGGESLRRVVTGLPVAGFNGSLSGRFGNGDPLGQGRVRAKTGTLTGVHGLAGTVTARDGTQLAFVAMADEVTPARSLEAEDLLDRIAAALAGCTCGTT